MFGIRKLLKFLGRSQQPEYDCEYALLPPPLSQIEASMTPRSWWTIIAATLRRSWALSVKPPTRAPRLTNSASHNDPNVARLKSAPFVRERPYLQLSEITAVDIVPLAGGVGFTIKVDEEVSTLAQPSSDSDEYPKTGISSHDHVSHGNTRLENNTTDQGKHDQLRKDCSGLDDGITNKHAIQQANALSVVTSHTDREFTSSLLPTGQVARENNQGTFGYASFDGAHKVISSKLQSVCSSDDDEWDKMEKMVDRKVLRADWAPLRATPEDCFRRTVLKALPGQHNVAIDDIHCVDEIQGGNNFVRILEIDGGDENRLYVGRWIIKVPCTGTAQRWQATDAYMLRNDAQTMRYIYGNTSIPVPEILAFSDSLDNDLGAPYVLMRANKGVSANKIWYERDEDGEDELEDADR
ncbi:hypothetical protein EK21DRAFT_86563 [Setomelanomma holmii]|uniref:Uncharacterized protein n=1 Tax=Setomelanomma holmii TaxID=210430 RepID=A0A9P4HGE7_9PLEO|nr:hypothetical protein EK21DRAFT_86563 [Setomelanomma holmii]